MTDDKRYFVEVEGGDTTIFAILYDAKWYAARMRADGFRVRVSW